MGPVRIANASGFYGDRRSAVGEQLRGGELDVVTGDYLAELTMLILGRQLARDASAGYARTFLAQMEEHLGEALDRNVAVVVNAGGLAPVVLAHRLRELADRLGLAPRIAHVEGDDLRGRSEELGLGQPLTANAYLGAFGIAACLDAGADVVVTGRVTDASLVVGVGVSRFGWTRDDLDALAGATVAGHVLECGAQATGGNLAGADLRGEGPLGFPIAELHADGSAVITTHVGTGGRVTRDSVTAQLLYEISGPRYLGPDVTARFDTVELADDGPGRVRIAGVRGEPSPPTLKVGVTELAGWRNEVTFVLTGLDVDRKAQVVREQLEAALAGRVPAEVRWRLEPPVDPHADRQDLASGRLHVAVRDDDPDVVGRAFSGACVELALASYAGFHLTAPPGDATPVGVFRGAPLDAAHVPHTAVLPDGTRVAIDDTARPTSSPGDPRAPTLLDPLEAEVAVPGPDVPTSEVPLGAVALARSGDKGGDANLGVWARHPDAWPWLSGFLTPARLRELLPETAPLDIDRYELANLHALNFVLHGLLGDGVAAASRFDPQAKAVGEWLRARPVPVPVALLDLDTDGGRGRQTDP